MNAMDATTQQVLAIVFVLTTVVLVITARFLQSRPSRRRKLRELPAFQHMDDWSSQAIEADRPLHLAFGSASIGEDNTAISLANAELFHHILAQNAAGDSPPTLSTSSASTVPLAQAKTDAVWTGDNSADSVHWLPQGKRSLAYAAGIGAVIGENDPPAHALAGSFGAEVGLILDVAHRRNQATLAVSDQLDGQAVAFALADETLIGEELFAAPAAVTDEGRAAADAMVMDVWRALLMVMVALALVFGVAGQLPWLSLELLAVVAVVALVLFIITRTLRRRRDA